MAAPYLQVEGLEKNFGADNLFTDLSLTINRGDKVGLIAQNGKGKSTLLRILAGEEDYGAGSIVWAKDLKIGYLSQVPEFAPDVPVLKAVIPEHAEDDWKAEDRAREMLHRLGVTDFEALPGKMSGGQLKRAAIARVLLREPQFLMLDEPTNHLDVDTIEWLEEYLSTRKTTLLMVTHDRWFLDRVCSRIVEIDRHKLYSYEGNYDYYLAKREERMAQMGAELAKVRNLLRTELDWMRRQPQARGSKAKYRIDAFYELQERSKVNLTNKQVNVAVQGSYIGSKIFEAHNVSKAFGEKVILRDWNYTFARYDKIGIVGPNGVGKTTLLRMLLGELQPDSGRFDVGQTVKFGYYSQQGMAEQNPRKKVIDAVREIAEDVWINPKTRLTASQFLCHFLFSVPDQQKYIAKLSGGEKRRLNLAITLMRQPNFLIFDEPTNDLDILTLSILEDYLSSFQGCVIVVSHDRFFLDRIANHLFVLKGNGEMEDFPGTYSQYRAVEKDRQAKAMEAASHVQRTSSDTRKPRERKGLNFKQRKEKEELENLLPTLEQERQTLTEQMSSGTMTSAQLQEAGARMAEIQESIDTSEMRLLELMELEE